MWYYAQDRQSFGPIPFEQLKEMARAGRLRPEDMVLQQGTTTWMAAHAVDGLFDPVDVFEDSTVGVAARPMTNRDAPPPLPATPPPYPPAAPGGGAGGYYTEETARVSAGAGVAYFLLLQLNRAFAWNVGEAEVSTAEREYLTRQGIDEETSQRYLAWRRSLLFLVLIIASISAILATINHISYFSLWTPMEAEVQKSHPAMSDFRIGWTGMGYVMIIISIVAPFALPLGAALAMVLWTRIGLSRQIVVWAWVISLLPLTFLMIPFRWMIRVSGLPSQVSEQVVDNIFIGINLVAGIGGFFLLLPIVLSVVAGAGRACLKIKTFLPGSIIPGWLLVISAYLQILIFLAFLVIINLIAGNALLIITAILVLAVPIVYIAFTRRFIQPMSPAELPVRLAPVRWTHLALVSAASLFFLIYALTAKVLGDKYLFGFSEDALMKPWSLLEYAINFVGRALFMTVLAVDQFMRVNLTVWNDSVRFAQTPEAAEYGHVMDKLQETMSKGI